MQLAIIPPGKGQIERGHRAHMVELTKPFRIGIHEVTQSQWKAVMKTEPWKGIDDVREGDNYPAVYITQDQALAFANGDKLNTATQPSIRLCCCCVSNPRKNPSG